MRKAADLTTLDIPRARKGEAVPVNETIGAGEGTIVSAAPAPVRDPTPAIAPAVQSEVVTQYEFSEPPPEAEPRTTVSVRLTLPLQERLRTAAFKSRRRKQDLVEAAIDEYLAKRGC